MQNKFYSKIADTIKGEFHSNYILLYFVLIALEWDSITLFTKMNLFFFQNSPFVQDIYMVFYLLT